MTPIQLTNNRPNYILVKDLFDNLHTSINVRALGPLSEDFTTSLSDENGVFKLC